MRLKIKYENLILFPSLKEKPLDGVLISCFNFEQSSSLTNVWREWKDAQRMVCVMNTRYHLTLNLNNCPFKGLGWDEQGICEQ